MTSRAPKGKVSLKSSAREVVRLKRWSYNRSDVSSPIFLVALTGSQATPCSGTATLDFSVDGELRTCLSRSTRIDAKTNTNSGHSTSNRIATSTRWRSSIAASSRTRFGSGATVNKRLDTPTSTRSRRAAARSSKRFERERRRRRVAAKRRVRVRGFVRRTSRMQNVARRVRLLRDDVRRRVDDRGDRLRRDVLRFARSAQRFGNLPGENSGRCHFSKGFCTQTLFYRIACIQSNPLANVRATLEGRFAFNFNEESCDNVDRRRRRIAMKRA